MRLFRKKPKKVILALGGGGARGLSNLGVMKVLEHHFKPGKMPFDMIIGTSIGSFLGAAYCLGIPADELEKKALSFNWQNMVDIGFRPTGLVKGDKFEEIITGVIGDKTFEDMKTPFALTTTDIVNGDEFVHTSGNLIKLIRASCSWPGIFSVEDIEGHLLADGGVRNSIPTKPAHKFGATFVIAVNPGFGVKRQEPTNAIKALIQTIQIMGEELNYYQSQAADIVIKPVLEDIHQFDFEKAPKIIAQGELAAEKIMPELKRKLKGI